MAKGASTSVATTTTTTTSQKTFTHKPSSFILFWFAFSLPLIAWDSLYVFLRPRSMEGGDLHWPLWVPYKLYGEIDHVYGWKAFNANSGFTGAQSLMNVVESLMYIYYAVVCYRDAVTVSGKKVIVGRKAAAAVLIAFSAGLCEPFSGYDNIGHNNLYDLIVLWIIPNGAWIVFPTYMIWKLGKDLVDSLAGPAHVKRD